MENEETVKIYTKVPKSLKEELGKYGNISFVVRAIILDTLRNSNVEDVIRKMKSKKDWNENKTIGDKKIERDISNCDE